MRFLVRVPLHGHVARRGGRDHSIDGSDNADVEAPEGGQDDTTATIPPPSPAPPPPSDPADGDDGDDLDDLDDEGLSTKRGYDAVLCGTGLVQAILASALSLSGRSVLHVDPAERYGELDASLTLRDLIDWAEKERERGAGDDGGRGGGGNKGEAAGASSVPSSSPVAAAGLDDGVEGGGQCIPDEAIEIHPECGMAGVVVHDSSTVGGDGSSSSGDGGGEPELPPPGTRVLTPYGPGSVLDAIPCDDNGSTKIVVSLTCWTLADGTPPRAFFAGSPSEVRPLKCVYLEEALNRHYRDFALDLSPSQLLLAKDEAVAGLVRGGVSDYVEFKSVESLHVLMEPLAAASKKKAPRIGGGGKATSTSTKEAKPTPAASLAKEGKATSPDAKKYDLELTAVPCSKADVFQSRLLSPLDKRRLMKLLQLASDYGDATRSAASASASAAPSAGATGATAVEKVGTAAADYSDAGADDGGGGDDAATASVSVQRVNETRIRSQGMSLVRPQNKIVDTSAVARLSTTFSQTPFGAYLEQEQKLHGDRLKGIVLHALALAGTGDEVTAGEGMDALYRHVGSLGRYGRTAFIATLYGSGELAQAFCRSSAVHGGVYMLRRPPRRILLDSTSSGAGGDGAKGEQRRMRPRVSGIILGGDVDDTTDSAGTEDKRIPARHVVVPANALLPSSEWHGAGSRGGVNRKCTATTTTTRTLRRIGVLRGKLMRQCDEQRCVVVIPPTAKIGNEGAVFGLVLDGSLHVAPSDGGVVYTIVHLTTTVTVETDGETEGDDDGGGEVSSSQLDCSVLGRAMDALLAATAGGSHRTGSPLGQAGSGEIDVSAAAAEAVEEIYHVTFSYADGGGSGQLPTSECSDDDKDVPSGLHVFRRPPPSPTVEGAFREAERLFYEIVDGSNDEGGGSNLPIGGMPPIRDEKKEEGDGPSSLLERPVFLKMARSIKEKIASLRRGGEGGDDDDEEGHVLESALSLMEAAQQQNDGGRDGVDSSAPKGKEQTADSAVPDDT